MHISVSEWSALKLALKLPRWVLDPARLPAAAMRYASTRRGMAVVGSVLIAVLVWLHVKAADPAATRLTAVTADLVEVKLIDSRWDAAVVELRANPAEARDPVQNRDVIRVQRALDQADAEARTTAWRTDLAELRKAYLEKADLVARLARAAADSHAALAAALRADAAVSTLVREAWPEFSRRERLVAAENLVVRVIAEAQKYQHAPTLVNRANLESFASDLTRAHSLPKAIEAGLERLESDVHQLLLLKPLEQTLRERINALGTAQRVDRLAGLYQRELATTLSRRHRYGFALVVFTAALAILLVYVGIRAIARYRDLELLYAAQTRELAKALHRLRDLEPGARAAEVEPESAESERAARLARASRLGAERR